MPDHLEPPTRQPTTAGVVESCHEPLVWLIPRLDDFPRQRRFTLGAQLGMGGRIVLPRWQGRRE